MRQDERPVCCVVERYCLAPANLQDDCRPARICVCFSCGLDVCRECSRRVTYGRYGRKRLCLSCIEERGIDRGARP